jgi:predicted nucleic acid-binding protein
MSEDQIFVDTNILVYAHDLDAREKHDTAVKKVSELWDRELAPSLSVQVLQEFYYNLIKKRVAIPTARAAVLDYLEWDVIENDRSLLVEGIAAQERWKSSFWDALIIAAAKRAKATILWSEDFNSGQDYDGIVVVNPLRKDA